MAVNTRSKYNARFKDGEEVVAIMLQWLSYENLGKLNQSTINWWNRYKEEYGCSPILYYIEDCPWDLYNPDSTTNAYDTLPMIIMARKNKSSEYGDEQDINKVDLFKAYVNETCTEIDPEIDFPAEYMATDCTSDNWLERIICDVLMSLVRIFKPYEVLQQTNYVENLHTLNNYIPTTLISEYYAAPH